MLELIVITGLSGSGKRTVMKAFEDLGYFCVDNLPVALVSKFVELCQKSQGTSRTALVIDARERQFLTNFPAIFQELQKNQAITLRMIFLEATDEALQRRFSETRRPHPLSETTSSLIEAIRAEKRLLEPIRDLADMVVDTSDHNVHTLRRYFVEQFSTTAGTLDLAVTVMSFGFKHGIPVAVDMMFDVRFLPNPHFIPELKPLTGQDALVAAFLCEQREVLETIERFCSLLDFLMPRYRREGRSYLTIGVGCTGGKHRSVYVADRLSQYLSQQGYRARANHRDIAKL